MNAQPFIHFAGIDPGLDGAAVILRCGGESGVQWISTMQVPTVQVTGGKRRRREYDLTRCADWARSLRDLERTVAILEKSQAMPGQGVVSMFRIGYGYGLLSGLLAGSGIPTLLVRPATWHRALCFDLPGGPKDKAVAACMRLLPQVPLVPLGCRVPHSGIADAALIAFYGIKTFGGT